MGKATGAFVFFATVVMIAVIEVPSTVDAFLEPFASQLIAKKMMLKHGLFPVPPAPQQTVYHSVQYHHQSRPSLPAPNSSPEYGQPSVYSSYPAYGPPNYPAYGPPPSYPAYGPPSPPSYPSYGPPNHSGYEPEPIVKPHSPVGCRPASNPKPQVDYSQYAVHGGHGYGSYGDNGGYGK